MAKTRAKGVLAQPPAAVARHLQALGSNLRTARLRRNLTIQAVADKLGVHRTLVADVERGRPTSSMAVMAGMLWTFNLLPTLGELAAPERDLEGIVMARAEERERARESSGGLSNDF